MLFFVAVTSAFAESTPHYPKLFFEYSGLYDNICAGNNPVDDAWASEASSKEPEFTKVWEDSAPLLFNQLFSDFKKGFTRNEMTATLSVCAFAPSYSNPLILNVSRFLKSYMKDAPVRGDHVFVDLVFHELLHTWVDENISETTPLLLKYKSESASVRAHLHLMALQVLVYKETGRNDLLEWINLQYPRMRGDYPRAWEIVNKEGYEAFIKEI